MSEVSNNNQNYKYVANNYNQMDAMLKIAQQNKEKLEKFKERVAAFAEIKTIEEARALAGKILPVANEINKFKVGDAKCTVVNRNDLFRICIDTEDEFIAYDFS